MSRHRTDFAPYSGPPAEREQFIRDNAVVVADDLTAKVRRQAAWITRLEKRATEHAKAGEESAAKIASLEYRLMLSVDFIAYMAAELDRFDCLCASAGPGAHAGTPPMMWPELVACIVAKAESRGEVKGHAVEGPPVREQESPQVSVPPVAAGEQEPTEPHRET